MLRAGTSAASSSKGELPCSPNATMLPTGKVALCPGVNNRMKGCKGKKVVDVVGKMGYKSPGCQLLVVLVECSFFNVRVAWKKERCEAVEM